VAAALWLVEPRSVFFLAFLAMQSDLLSPQSTALSRSVLALPSEVAHAQLRAALANHPRDHQLWCALGMRHAADGHADAAIAALQQSLALAPGHVKSQACLGVLLHAHGDPQQAAEAYDPAGMVACSCPLGADPAAMQAFHAALTAHLYAHPSLSWDRAGKATRRGWQTGELLHADAPAVRRLQRLLGDSLLEFLNGDDEGAPEGEDGAPPLHDAQALATAGLRVTAWGVMLQSEGYQDLHIHEAGLVSGVYYVDVPAMTGPPDAGCLRFPTRVDWLLPAATRPAAPDFIVRPSAGLLVMFPSFLWHGTVPFLAGHDRVCIAFDLTPTPSD
jgi:hypothetical protein